MELLHIPESTICMILRKYNATGNVENISRVGRPKKATQPVEARLLRTAKKNRVKVFRAIINKGCAVHVCPKTVQFYLQKEQNI